MIIRVEQIRALGVAAEARFIDQLTAYLRRNLPNPAAEFDDATLRQKVSAWRVQASGYGVTTQLGIAQWSYLSLVAGEAFSEAPEISAFLRRDPSTSGDARIAILLETVKRIVQPIRNP